MKRLLLSLLLLLSLSAAAAFVTPRPSAATVLGNSHHFQPLFSSSEAADIKPVPLIINGQNIELTEAIVEHVTRRIGGVVNKLAGRNLIRECDVILSVSKNPKYEDSHRVEVVTNVKGTTIIVKSQSPDMYSSIDAVSHALNRKLLKYKERRTAGWHGGASMSEDMLKGFSELEQMETEIASEPEELFDDPEKPEVVKIKSFDLDHPISVDEAIFALDYVDHDFYVFKNAETDKVSVVYKRHGGGIGLIEP